MRQVGNHFTVWGMRLDSMYLHGLCLWRLFPSMNKNINYEQEHELCTMVFSEALLNVCGGMGFHPFIAQVGFENGRGRFLLWYDDLWVNACFIWNMNMNMNYTYDFSRSFTKWEWVYETSFMHCTSRLWKTLWCDFFMIWRYINYACMIWIVAKRSFSSYKLWT